MILTEPAESCREIQIQIICLDASFDVTSLLFYQKLEKTFKISKSSNLLVMTRQNEKFKLIQQILSNL